MKTKDLNAAFDAWFDGQLDELFNAIPQDIDPVEQIKQILQRIDGHHFFFDEAKKSAVNKLYHRLSQFPKQTKHTADFFGLDPKTVYSYTKNAP